MGQHIRRSSGNSAGATGVPFDKSSLPDKNPLRLARYKRRHPVARLELDTAHAPLSILSVRMNRLRSSWFASLTSAVLAFGLLVALVRPAAVAATDEREVTPVEWLRTQLRTPDDPLVEAALEHVAQAPDASMDALVRAFAEAYLALAPLDASLADVFEVQAADEAVLDVLQQRFQRLSGESLPQLFLLAATPTVLSSVQYRLDGGPPAGLAHAVPRLLHRLRSASLAEAQVLTFAFRLYSSARSLGP